VVRHPGERRDPAPVYAFELQSKGWIPAFAGMTTRKRHDDEP
jgi:hypothetical protein